MTRTTRFFSAALTLLLASQAIAQDDRTFGFEFEFAGEGNRIVQFESMPFENYQKLLAVVAEHYRADPSTVERIDFTKPTTNLERFPSGERALFKAHWTDPRGRTWIVEPEFVSSNGYDGYELVTPPLTDTEDLRQILQKIKESGLVREGLKSGVHLTLDGRGLVKANGDAKALTNLILMHENMEPMLRRLFNPIRGGGHANRFARQLAVDHPELLEKISALSAADRTSDKLAELFRGVEAREAQIMNADPLQPTSWAKVWKYRSMNLAKALQINDLHDGKAGLVEFRMFDLSIENPEVHELQARVYRAMVERAIAMAEAGETVAYKPRAAMPEGADPSIYNTPDNPNEAKAELRGMVEALGLDSSPFEAQIDRTIQPRPIPDAAEFRGMLDAIPMTRTMHNGEAFTYGFELEGRGQDVVSIMVPTDSDVRARWDAMSLSQKKAYFRQNVTEPDYIEEYFEPDTRIKWLDPYWYVEGTGNWEIHSKVMDNLADITEAMREAVRLTGKSGKGFHLHMRDNAPDWDMLNERGGEFADFIDRSANWVWLERVRRLRTDLSLQSWSNSRITPSNVEGLANMSGNGRNTVRIQFNQPGYIDLEIRGLTKFVDDIETLGKIYTNALQTGNFGPWRATDNLIPAEDSRPNEARFEDVVEEYLRRVEGKSMSPELREVVKGLQLEYAERAGSDTRFYPSGVSTPLLGWEHETAFSEDMRRDLKFQKDEFTRYLIRHAESVMDGKFGFDMELVSVKGLVELGLPQLAAEAYVRSRRAEGEGSMEEALRLAAMSGNAADLAKLELAMGVDMNEADAEIMKERLGLTDAEVEKVLAYRETHTVNSSARFAGLNAQEIADLQARGAAFDLGAEGLTAEQIKDATGISLAKAKKLVAYRDAHNVTTEANLRAAGLTVAQAREVLAASGTPVNLETITKARMISELGLTEAKAEALIEARETHTFRRWTDLSRAGLSTAAITRLRAHEDVERLTDIEYMDEWDLERAGLTEAQARRMVLYRDAIDMEDVDDLERVLGQRLGQQIYRRANSVDLRTADVWDLEYEANLDSEIAEKIVRYRDANRIGGGPMSNYDAVQAADQLIDDAEILSEADRAKIERTGGINLETATVEDLTTTRMGMTEAQAKAFVGFRDAASIGSAAELKTAGLTQARASAIWKLAESLDLAESSVAKIVERTGLTEAKAAKYKTMAAVDFETATVQAMRDAGLTQALARKLVKFRDSAQNMDELDYKTMVRELRLRVKKWVTESGMADALLRSLLPRPEASRLVTEAREGSAEGFGPRRAGAAGEVAPAKIPVGLIEGTFEAIIESARVSTAMRLAESEASVREGALESIEQLKLQVVESNDILAEKQGEVVRISTGLINEIDARSETLPAAQRGTFRLRVLGLIFGHEVAHASGIKVEAVADAEGLRILAGSKLVNLAGLLIPVSETEIRETVKLFNKPTGATHVDNMLTRLRTFFRYGTARARVRNLEAINRGEADRLARYRRADGTLRWKSMVADRALKEGVGTVHFALALFLKEIAVVAKTGDRARMEEFFDGLMTTDFYKHYGLFVVGARAGEVAYTKYLQRFVKPRFVNGILKTNLVLATGIALPQLVDGTFEGQAFAITLGSLGLSSAAVKTGMRGINWVVDLSKVKNTRAVQRLAGMRRLARFGGWFYTAAELAVVLYLAEDLERAVHGFLDRRAARKSLQEAGTTFLDAVTDPDATADTINAAGIEYHLAWIDFRNFLYAPLFMEEEQFAVRLEGVARKAKLAEDQRVAMLAQLENNPNLAENLLARHASLEAYAASITAEADAEVESDVDMYMSSYQTNRDAHMTEVYEGNRRDGGLLGSAAQLEWSREAGTGMAGITGRRNREQVVDALDNVSFNRLQTYPDELEVIRYAQAQLNAEKSALFAPLIQVIERTTAADRSLYENDGVANVEGDPEAGPGLIEEIEEIAAEQE